MRSLLCALGASAVLAGCTGATGPPPQTVVELTPAAIGAPTFNLAGPPSAATIAVRLRSPRRLLAKTVAADLKSLTFALVAWALDSAPAGATGLAPVGSLFTFNTTAQAASLTFTNVPANATGKAYHVVVAAFDNTAGTGANITNATGSDAATGRVRLAGSDGPYYVSANAVRVEPGSNALTGTSALEVALKLLD